MLLEVLGHPKSPDPLLAKYGLHLLIRSEELLVLGVLEVVALDVSPESLHHLGPPHLLSFLSSDKLGQLWREVQWFGETTSFGHLEFN